MMKNIINADLTTSDKQMYIQYAIFVIAGHIREDFIIVLQYSSDTKMDIPSWVEE